MKPPVAWTIAGFDPSSGAGLTADLMTFAAHGVFGCSAMTAMTVQSTQAVARVEPVRPTLLAETLDCLAADLPPVGVKIGMLGTPEILAVVAASLTKLRAAGLAPHVVLDPVLKSSSGRELYPSRALGALRAELLPLVECITPNWSELSLLAGKPVRDLGEAEGASRHLIESFPGLHVVATGGDQSAPVDLLVTPAGERREYPGTHIETKATHGTGCAFSSALLAHLVAGATVAEAVRGAKDYVAGAMLHAPKLGGGKGPLNLLWTLRAGDR